MISHAHTCFAYANLSLNATGDLWDGGWTGRVYAKETTIAKKISQYTRPGRRRGPGGRTLSVRYLEILVTCLSVDGPRRIYNCPVRARRRARVRDPLSLVISVRDRASARTVTVHAGVHADGSTVRR